MERPDTCNAEEWSEWENRELGVEVEPKQEREDQAGAGDLLPEVDWAEPLRSGPSPPSCLLGIGGRGRAPCGEPVLSGVEGLRRTRKQKLEKPAEGAGIAMIVGVGHQEQEPDGEQDHRRRHARYGDASISSLTCDHLLPPQE